MSRKTMKMPMNAAIPDDIINVLHELGIPDEPECFYFIAYAVQLALEQPQRLALVTKWLYPAISDKYSVSVSSVQNSIRNAIQAVFSGQRTVICERLFPYCQSATTARFIAVIIRYLTTENDPPNNPNLKT